MKPLVALDVECLPNYFLIGFKGVDSGKVITVEAFGNNAKLSSTDIAKVKSIFKSKTVFGFNSMKYDMPMIAYALSGATTSQLHALSTKLVHGEPHWRLLKELGVSDVECDHFDIMEPAPAVMISLKNYGTRIGSKRLWEFFVDPMQPVDRETADKIAEYNVNDLDVTIDLFNAIKGEIELREFMGQEYGLELRSKSGAQVAEVILLKETKYNGGRPDVPDSVRYKAPSCVKFKSEKLNELKDTLESHSFKINKGNGSPVEPTWMKQRGTVIGNTKYKVGLGGIHDQRKKSVYHSDDCYFLLDIDVQSYYPSMIIEFGFAPKHIKSEFYRVYKKIYTERIAAKKAGDKLKDKSLKLLLNSTFGKLGSMYSKLYSPDLMLQVTITGQLMLLMLIEAIEDDGIEVFYANTDGITVRCPRNKVDRLRLHIFDWELATGMVMEETEFRSVAIRDVNSFVNITSDGKVKAKGIYGETSLSKGLQTPVVFQAVRQYLLDGTPIENTIRNCSVVQDFLTARTVKGGGVWSGEYLGKMVRWFHSTDGHSINYKTNGNLVPKTGTGVTPMMDLTDEIPSNLDYDWYLNEAIEMLLDLGVKYGK